MKDSEFYPIDVARVFRSLDRIKPHVKAWYADNSLAQQLIEQEEVDLIADDERARHRYDPQRQGAVRDGLATGRSANGGGQGWIVAGAVPQSRRAR